MRRFLAALVSGGVGVGLYAYLGQSKPSMVVSGATILAVYGAIDWLGLLPPPFEQGMRALLHDQPEEKKIDFPSH